MDFNTLCFHSCVGSFRQPTAATSLPEGGFKESVFCNAQV